jgi:exopolyphosphatase / guanosine-5'-triphosphate,3'-diphosphate pyrophosphatase
MSSPTLSIDSEQERQERKVTKVAALDIGSNSFHLVVARIVAHDVQILHQLKRTVQLADGLDESDWLSDEAMQRGLQNLRVIAESLKDFEPDSVRVVATYTLRKARNAKSFIQAARDIFPYPVEVISGVEEARLIYLGVAHTSYHEGNRLVIDVGGGSTELIIGRGLEPQLMRSVQIGCVTLTKRFFADGKIKATPGRPSKWWTRPS